MTKIRWPGPGTEADLLVLQYALGLDVSDARPVAGQFLLPEQILGHNRITTPPVTTHHPVAVVHILEPFEEEGYFFTVGNSGGSYQATISKAGVRFEAKSRVCLAEAICLAALKARGHELEMGR